MSEAAAAPVRRRKRVDFYKWTAGVLVPVAVASIGLIKVRGGGVTTTPGNSILVTNITMIENQYQQVTGQPLADPATKQLLESAVNLAKAGQYDASRRLFEQVAAAVPVPAVYNNLGALYAEAGESEKAQDAYQKAIAKDPDYKPARENLAALSRAPEKRSTAGGREAEPNQDIPRANEMPLSTAVEANIGDVSDMDTYQIKAAPPPRDIITVSITNESTTLSPQLTVFDGDKNSLHTESRQTAGANLEYSFAAEPNKTYYLKVDGGGRYGSSTGTYTLVAKALKKYDRFEPNEDVATATRVSLGKPIEADVMDVSDNDFFQVTSQSANLSVTITNSSSTLAPALTIFDGQKSQIRQESRNTKGANLEFSFAAQPGMTYYLQVNGGGVYGSSFGSYSLIVK